ncbi:ABC transporter permease [Natronolimnobius sp. AArcel1]|uniref:ABC transporter permease n=1 Tax=Natronolimnobius sp. AArcel1 TaxID=1679093 RepID=UPI001F15644D|nr:ABC transporter permease [Natronolimnobius sp. AArcel1]
MVFAAVPSVFTNFSTVQLMVYTMVPLGLVVLAESVCLLSGHFDLSVGSIAGFSAVFTAMAFGSWGLISNPFVGILLIVAVGGFIGLLNGIFIAKFGVNPFLQTLAFLIIFGGGKLALTTQPVFGLPDGYLFVGGTIWVAVGVLIASFLAVSVIFKYTNFGRAVYAVGSDKESAREVGINVDGVIIAVYTMSGIFCGLAGLMLTGFIGGVPPDIADDMVFPAFAAAIIGGISLFGGRGKLMGAFGGLLLLSLIQTSLNVAGTDPTVIGVIEGVVLLIAILLYTTKARLRQRILSAEVA